MKKISSLLAATLIVLTGCLGTKENIQSDATKKETERVARTEEAIDHDIPQKEEFVDDTVTATTEYRDGTYTADGSYTVHDGEILENVKFALTIENDTITDFELIGEVTHPDSAYHQEDFMTKATPQVVGADLADLDIDVVAGSSATTKGFQKALEDAKKQAMNENNAS